AKDISSGVNPTGLPSIRTTAFAGTDLKLSLAASCPARRSRARRFASSTLLSSRPPSAPVAPAAPLREAGAEADFLSGDNEEFIFLLSPAKPAPAVALPVAAWPYSIVACAAAEGALKKTRSAMAVAVATTMRPSTTETP